MIGRSTNERLITFITLMNAEFSIQLIRPLFLRNMIKCYPYPNEGLRTRANFPLEKCEISVRRLNKTISL